MKVIGITGTTGSGKTTALARIKAHGGLVLDCDKIYHRLLRTDDHMRQLIENAFPGTIKNGRFDRKALGRRVFDDPVALMTLNGITHGCVHEKIIEKLMHSRKPFAAIDAIALFESGADRLCDFTVAVTAPEEVRVKRLLLRENITEEYARARIAAQKDAEFFCDKCDYVLENNGTKEEFEKKCDDLFSTLLGEAYGKSEK